MESKGKKLNILIILFSLLCAFLIFFSGLNKEYFAYADGLNYNALIYIEDDTDDGTGYILHNISGDNFYSDDSLSNIIAGIIANCSNTTVSIAFDIENNEESMVINCNNKTLSVAGSFESIKSSGTIIKLESGTLYWAGLILSSETQALKINQGATFNMNSGKINVVSGTDFNSIGAVEINGKATINGNEITYSSDSEKFGYGIYIGSYDEDIVINNTNIIGNSAIAISSGNLKINSGIFTANETNIYNTSAGDSLVIMQEANVTINGGTFTSNGGVAVRYKAYSDTTFEITGGTFTGGFKVPYGSDSTLLFNGVIFKAGEYFSTILDVASGSFIKGTTTDDEVLVYSSTTNNTDGYRMNYWSWVNGENCGSIDSLITTLDQFSSGDEVTPIGSNIYSLELMSYNGENISNQEVEYMSIFDLENIACERLGYNIVGWSTSLGGDVEFTSTLTVDKDYVLYNVCELKDPTLNSISDILCTYEGEFNFLEIIPQHDLEVNYIYQWQIYENEFIDIADANDSIFSVKDVNESGIYRVKITTTYEEESIENYSNEINVNITKAVYSNITYPIQTGTYDPDITLADFVLSDNYQWKNPTTVPNCAENYYAAIYSENDNNYSDYEFSINIVLEKANFSNISHIGYIDDYNPNKTLNDYELGDNYFWEDPSIIPQCPSTGCSETSYVAFYNTDAVNYNNYALNIVFQLKKIDYEGNKDVVIETTYCDGDSSTNGFTLYYIELFCQDIIPSGYDFNMKKSTMANIYLYANSTGFVYTDCIYDYDPTNYYSLSDITITLIVAKADYTDITHDGFSSTYSPTQYLSDFQLEENYNWVNPSIVPTCDITNYSATYNDDEDNYNDYIFDISIKLSKSTYNIDEYNYGVEFNSIYSPSLHLADFPLSENYNWVDPDIIPTVDVIDYAVIYNADEINYCDCNIYCKVILKKIDYDMSNFLLSDKKVTYTGQPNYIEYEGSLPDGVILEKYNNNSGYIQSGKYCITVNFIQEDMINYNIVPNKYVAYLTIEKAESVITAEERQSFTYDGTVKSIVASLNNSEQKLNYSIPNQFIDKGSYEISLSTTESINYLSSQKEVTIFINTKIKELGSSALRESDIVGNIAFGLIQNSTGIEEDVTINMAFLDIATAEMEVQEDCVALLEINLLLDNNQYEYRDEEYTITVLLPKSLQDMDTLSVSYVDENGNSYECKSYINGNCIIFKTNDFGNFEITNSDDNSLEWWAWFLISLGIAIILVGLGYTVFKFKKKNNSKKSKLDGIIENDNNNKDELTKNDENI
jgi:hypothetical protein